MKKIIDKDVEALKAGKKVTKVLSICNWMIREN